MTTDSNIIGNRQFLGLCSIQRLPPPSSEEKRTAANPSQKNCRLTESGCVEINGEGRMMHQATTTTTMAPKRTTKRAWLVMRGFGVLVPISALSSFGRAMGPGGWPMREEAMMSVSACLFQRFLLACFLLSFSKWQIFSTPGNVFNLQFGVSRPDSKAVRSRQVRTWQCAGLSNDTASLPATYSFAALDHNATFGPCPCRLGLACLP